MSAGKGSGRRPEAKPGNYDRGYVGIKWPSQEEKAKKKKKGKK